MLYHFKDSFDAEQVGEYPENFPSIHESDKIDERKMSFDLPPPPLPDSPPPEVPPLSPDVEFDIQKRESSGSNNRQGTISMLPPPDFD